MEKWHIIMLLLVGMALLLTAVRMRIRHGDKYEIKTIDLVLMVLPLLFVLLITGKMKVLDAFGIKADFSELFADAADNNIVDQVSDTSSPGVEDVVHMLEMSTKGGVQEIPRLIEKKTEALIFRLGHGGYYGPAIEQYFDALYASSYFQYLVVLDHEDRLFGIYNVMDLAVQFRTQGDGAYDRFADWLNRANPSDQQELAKMPGFTGAEDAVDRKQSKREVLQKMDNLRLTSLPVVDKQGLFVGTVERAQLTAGLILEVADRIESSAGS